jgi:hypothetical protein
MITPHSVRIMAKKKQVPHIIFVARKYPGDLEPVVEHVQMDEQAVEKDVDERNNLLLESGCMLEYFGEY